MASATGQAFPESEQDTNNVPYHNTNEKHLSEALNSYEYHGSARKLSSNNPDLASLTKSKEICACPRDLTTVEQESLKKDTRILSEYKQQKLELDAHKNWDKFYKRNTTKFFKDRHWTKREFQELCGDYTKKAHGSDKTVLLEVGCGVGNLIFPLLDEEKSLFIYACDFSPRAVEFIKENPLFDASTCNAFVCDVIKSPLTDNIPANSIDVATLIFVLSAIHPDKMETALQNIHQVLRPGGMLLFRDYGLYDYAMLRFAPGHKLSDNFYVRQDGTRAYYFSTEELGNLASRTGFQVISNEYVKRETVNKKEGLCVPRIFVQGKFVKNVLNPDMDSHSS